MMLGSMLLLLLLPSIDAIVVDAIVAFGCLDVVTCQRERGG